MRRTQTSKNVNMVAGAAHGVGDSVHAANRAAEVFVDATTSLGTKPRFPVFRGEDEMVVEGQMRRGHAGASRARSGAQPEFFWLGGGGSFRRFRSAPPPANFSAPSGSALSAGRQTAPFVFFPFAQRALHRNTDFQPLKKSSAPEERKPLAGGETTGNHRSIWIGAPEGREKRANHPLFPPTRGCP